MYAYRSVLILVLEWMLALSMSGMPQDPQEAFEKELIAACRENDTAQVKDLIQSNRLWVKPVVDHLITRYIRGKLTGNTADTTQHKNAAILISDTFHELHEERSLQLAVDYLNEWNRKDLDIKYRADSLNRAATTLRISGQNPDLAIESYHLAIKEYREIGDERGVADILGALGAIYWTRDTDTCLAFYLKALEEREKVNDLQLMGNSLISLGLVYAKQLSDGQKGVAYFRKAARLREEIKDFNALGMTMYSMATAYENLGDPESAANAYHQAFERFGQVERRDWQARAKVGSAHNLQIQGKYTEALKDLEEVLVLSRETGDTLYYGDALTQMALVYANMGELEAAVDKATLSLPVFPHETAQWIV